MPIIDVHHASSLTDEQAGELIESLTKAFVNVTGANPESLHVLIQQIDSDRWGVGGRTLTARRAS